MASDVAAAAIAPGAGRPADPWTPVPYVVRARRQETADIATLELAPERGAAPFEFSAGQFNMLYAFGVGEAAISISGDTRQPDRLVHTVRIAGRVSRALYDAMPGSVLGVRGPYGRGWPVAEAEGHDVVLVAGGLGLPPLRPVLYRILAERSKFDRVEVIYGSRTPPDLVYYDEIQRWRARTDLRFQTTVDKAGRDWYGDVGVVTTRLPDARFEPSRTIAMLCGPEIMMRLTAEALQARGVSPDAIWVSMERNMKCAVGLCGHCQLGPAFVCRNGPVFRYSEIRPYLAVREV
ncbi:MAG TPA: FAD/NAD(P)-binding protein [Thermoplasmata archaeon]|nr:FAD/NAD(P)-binding protein [Thermoplasmata archaeon]